MNRTVCWVVVLVGLTAVLSQVARSAEKATEAPRRAPDCVYVGTPSDVVAKMLEMAKITKEDVVCDPGCGDGRMVIAAAKRYGCRGIGYEIDPKLAAEARKLVQKRKVEHLVKIEEKDIFTVDYRANSVIVMYLLPDMIVRLLPQFEKLKPGSRIVAHDYPIRDIAPDTKVDFRSNEDNVEHTLYSYTVPLKKES